jgi:hypothetical protein
MKEAFNRWKKLDEIIDDITAIIIFFDPKWLGIYYISWIIKKIMTLINIFIY